MSRLNLLFHKAKHDNNKSAFSQLKSTTNASPLDVEALNMLGICYINGYGVSRKPEKAIAKWKQAAYEGSDVAMCNLGLLCLDRNDPAQAANWFLESAKRNSNKSSGSLKAFDRLLAMSRAPNPDSTVLNNIGSCYEHGYSVEQNLGLAKQYYQQAAALGNDEALCNLGLLYQNGLGVPQNPVVAEFWFEESVKKRSNNPKGSLRAAKQLENLSVELANHYYRLLSENTFSSVETVETLKKLDRQHRILLQKDVNNLQSRRDELRQANHPNEELEQIGTLITHLKSVINYPCCVSKLTEKKEKITQLLSTMSTEALHLKTFIERTNHINQFNDRLRLKLTTIRSKINDQTWLVKNLFGDFKVGTPAGIGDIRNIQDAINTNSTHDLYNAFTQIVHILTTKTLPSSRRHPATSRFYSESLTDLTSLRFNEEIVDCTMQQKSSAWNIGSRQSLLFVPFDSSPATSRSAFDHSANLRQCMR